MVLKIRMYNSSWKTCSEFCFCFVLCYVLCYVVLCAVLCFFIYFAFPCRVNQDFQDCLAL